MKQQTLLNNSVLIKWVGLPQMKVDIATMLKDIDLSMTYLICETGYTHEIRAMQYNIVKSANFEIASQLEKATLSALNLILVKCEVILAQWQRYELFNPMNWTTDDKDGYKHNVIDECTLEYWMSIKVLTICKDGTRIRLQGVNIADIEKMLSLYLINPYLACYECHDSSLFCSSDILPVVPNAINEVKTNYFIMWVNGMYCEFNKNTLSVEMSLFSEKYKYCHINRPKVLGHSKLANYADRLINVLTSG